MSAPDEPREPPADPSVQSTAPADDPPAPLVDHPKPLGPPWPDYTPPRRSPPVIAPRAPKRRRGQGLLKPEHRMTLFLLASSSGALLLTLIFPQARDASEAPAAGPEAGPATAPAPLEWPRERGASTALTRPDGLAAAPPAADLDGAMARVVPAVNACAQRHAAALAPLDGRVRLRLEVGATGLEAASLVDVAEVAPAPAACLAAAAWGAGWPLDLPAQAVTLPFFVVAPLADEGAGPPAAAPPAEPAPPSAPVSPGPR